MHAHVYVCACMHKRAGWIHIIIHHDFGRCFSDSVSCFSIVHRISVVEMTNFFGIKHARCQNFLYYVLHINAVLFVLLLPTYMKLI